MQRIQNYWFSQTIAEYTSSARTVELSHWMQRLGFGPQLIREAIRISDDEMVHSLMCQQLAIAAGSTQSMSIAKMSLSLQEEYSDLRKSVLLVIVQSFCFGETVAVPLFAKMRKTASHAQVLKTFDRILDDEPRHASFGWKCLAWCIEQWPEAKQWLEEIVPIGLQRMRRAYAVQAEFNPVLSEQEIEWGVFPRLLYAKILEDTIYSIYARRLLHYGITIPKI